MGNQPSGSTLAWSTDQSRSFGRSLKITKSATSDSAAWISENMCDIWSPQHLKNVDILIGAYVRTSGVNINPANADATWYVSYSFYDTLGVLIGTTMLPIDQSVASSSGWVADTNLVGETILPKDSWKTIIKFVGGKNATGTVWADDFMLYGRAGAWAGQDWNAGVGVPTGWFYWLPPNGGNDGLLANGFENTKLTTEAAHSGTTSLKFDLPFARAPHDGFVGTKRMLLNGTGIGSIASLGGSNSFGASTVSTVHPGDILRATVWVKADNLVPDSAAMYPSTWAIGLTPLFDKGNANNLGYNPTGPDLQFALPAPQRLTGCQSRQTAIQADPRLQGTNRLHIYSRFTGLCSMISRCR
jgi:hypothetical protein